MFRGTKKPFWDDEKVIALYEGVLRRSPQPFEVVGLREALNKSGDVKRALQDMLSSHEFGIMMLPDLVNEHITRTPQQPMFFLHIPKTAGTSFRLELSDALGVPAFLLFIHTSWQGLGTDEAMRFWPFWAGHAGISAFPETHRGITVFRETRSRILSAYRQYEREPPFGHLQPRFYEESNKIAYLKGITPASTFTEWLKFRTSAVMWFVPVPSDPKTHQWNGVPNKKYLDQLSTKDINAALTSSLARFDSAAWAHDQQGMSDAIQRVAGREVSTPPRHENVFRSLETTKATRITKDDLRTLEALASEEELLFKIAADRGLIPTISRDFADEQFEKTAERLGFDFA